MKNRYGVLTYDNWNIMHLCVTAGVNPFVKMDDAGFKKFSATSAQLFGGAKLLTDDLNNPQFSKFKL